MAGDAATTWGVGAYPEMALRLEPVATRAVQLARVGAGDRVLDVACGTGNGALTAAAVGATVVGIDLEPALLAIARERTGPDVRGRVDWRVGDAEALPADDAAFDAVLSLFGVMYAADHERAAGELARVAAPGARVVLASWAPGSLMPAMGGALAPFLPPPPAASGPPSRWGDRDELTALLGAAGIELREARVEALTMSFEDRLSAVGFLVRTAGHVLAERERLEAEGRWAQLLAALGALVGQRAAGGPAGLTLTLEYLLARGYRL